MKGVLDPQGLQTLGAENRIPRRGLAQQPAFDEIGQDREQMPVAHPQIGRCLGMGLTVKPLALRLEKEGRQAVSQRIHLIAGSGAGDADGLFIGKNTELPEKDKKIYADLGLSIEPFKNVRYYYPYTKDEIMQHAQSYAHPQDVERQKKNHKAFTYKFTYDKSQDKLDLLLANEDDSTGTLESCVNLKGI